MIDSHFAINREKRLRLLPGRNRIRTPVGDTPVTLLTIHLRVSAYVTVGSRSSHAEKHLDPAVATVVCLTGSKPWEKVYYSRGERGYADHLRTDSAA